MSSSSRMVFSTFSSTSSLMPDSCKENRRKLLPLSMIPDEPFSSWWRSSWGPSEFGSSPTRARGCGWELGRCASQCPRCTSQLSRLAPSAPQTIPLLFWFHYSHPPWEKMFEYSVLHIVHVHAQKHQYFPSDHWLFIVFLFLVTLIIVCSFPESRQCVLTTKVLH